MTNEEYQRVRDAFIPFAEARANEEIKPENYPIKAIYKIDWDNCFMKQMDRLCRKAGLIWKR